MSDRRRAIGFVLTQPMMPQSDLMLVVEPFLIVLRVGGIQNPLAEVFAHCTQIIAVRLSIQLAGEVMK